MTRHPRKFSFEGWAVVGPNDDTGLGRMAQDFKAVLPIGRHLVTSTGRLENRPLVAPREVLLPDNCGNAELEELLGGLDGVILLERHLWHRELLKTCRRIGVRSVCVPMWEWFRGKSRQWHNCDFFACPNEYCLRVVRSYGFTNSSMVPWAFDLSRFPARVVKGRARTFIHNAGLVDADDRKGTYDSIAAFRSVASRDIKLKVRSQKELPWRQEDSRVSVEIGNAAEPAKLYEVGDVFIQPSKLEGMGFMVLEAVASGLPVITTDYPPMNEWVKQPELLAKPSIFRFPAYSSAWIEHSHLKIPRRAALARAIGWTLKNDLESVSRANRAHAEELFNRERVLRAWEALLSEVLRTPADKAVVGEEDDPAPCLTLSSRIRAKVREITGVRIPMLGRTP